jgi:hypothetical protein
MSEGSIGFQEQGSQPHVEQRVVPAVAQEKINNLSHSFEAARPQMRTLLGLQEGVADSFFLGTFGSCVSENGARATENSDIDGYLFYNTTANTPENPYLNYDLAQCFDSPAQSLFGYPQGRKPPNPEGKEDIEAHDLTSLAALISGNYPVEPRRLREIATAFSPVCIGDPTVINKIRNNIVQAMQKRTGRWYKEPEQISYGIPPQKDPAYGAFNDFQADGKKTWEIVAKEYSRLFKKDLVPIETLSP